MQLHPQWAGHAFRFLSGLLNVYSEALAPKRIHLVSRLEYANTDQIHACSIAGSLSTLVLSAAAMDSMKQFV